MPRIVSVWLPRWPILRFLAAQARSPASPEPVDPRRPFVLAITVPGGPCIAAANPAAEKAGLAIGDRLSDARAKAGPLQVRMADPAADGAALRKLALWATRYTPAVSAWGEADGADGFFLDVAGTAHLFGSEEALLADLADRLRRFGLAPRLALANTLGAAWALSHYRPAAPIIVPAPCPLPRDAYATTLSPWERVPREAGRVRDWTAGSSHQSGGALQGSPFLDRPVPHPAGSAGHPLPEGEGCRATPPEAEALASLPIEALRLSTDARSTLRRLGFKRVGALIGEARAPFAARFEKEVLARLDQALGRAPEPLPPIVPPPAYHTLRHLLEPLTTQEAVVAVAQRLMRDLVPALLRDGVGARALRLSLYRVDSAVQIVAIGLALPTRNPTHVARLIDLKLDRLAGSVDAGFGFETLALAVTAAESLRPRQADLADCEDDGERSAVLIDKLEQRLGPGRVRQIAPVASHLPERAEAPSPVAGGAPAWPAPETGHTRPILLLPRAEPAEVTALVPEGPPRRFRWRGTMHGVARAQGPERIAAEWWRSGTAAPTRDYYLVEDEAGRRFWLYREGFYGRETAAPRWFVHGLFA